MSLLRTENLTVEIAGKTVCRDLNWEINSGECWAVLGINGSGKTTLLHTLAGLRQPVDGSIYLQDSALSALSRQTIASRLGIMFQHQQDIFPATVMETVLIGRHPHLRAWQWESPEDFASATEALVKVGLVGFEQRSLDTLSGGERQRVSLAILLAQSPMVMLMDEPVNHLDIHQQQQVMQLLNKDDGLRQRARLIVLHDINLAARYCDHVMLLNGQGDIISGQRDEVLTAENLSDIYRHPIRVIDTDQGCFFLPK